MTQKILNLFAYAFSRNFLSNIFKGPFIDILRKHAFLYHFSTYLYVRHKWFWWCNENRRIFRKNSWKCIKFRILLPIWFQLIVQWLQPSFWPKKCIRRLSGRFIYHCHSFNVIKNIWMEPFFPSIIFLFDKQASKNSALTSAWNVSSFFFFWMI